MNTTADDVERTYRDPVGVLLADPLSLGLALVF
jgi:hypothetical protein